MLLVTATQNLGTQTFQYPQCSTGCMVEVVNYKTDSFVHCIETLSFLKIKNFASLLLSLQNFNNCSLARWICPLLILWLHQHLLKFTVPNVLFIFQLITLYSTGKKQKGKRDRVTRRKKEKSGELIYFPHSFVAIS